VEQEAKKRPEVLRLMTHPGVGALTGLAFVLIIGSAERFACGKQIGSYLGLIPCEDSSANRQRYASLIFDAAGNLYGTTEAGGTYTYGTAFELTPVYPCTKGTHDGPR
jgi:hypothetical protein